MFQRHCASTTSFLFLDTRWAPGVGRERRRFRVFPPFRSVPDIRVQVLCGGFRVRHLEAKKIADRSLPDAHRWE